MQTERRKVNSGPRATERVLFSPQTSTQRAQREQRNVSRFYHVVHASNSNTRSIAATKRRGHSCVTLWANSRQNHTSLGKSESLSTREPLRVLRVTRKNNIDRCESSLCATREWMHGRPDSTVCDHVRAQWMLICFPLRRIASRIRLSLSEKKKKKNGVDK